MAIIARVSNDTIDRVKKIVENASEPAEEKLRRGESIEAIVVSARANNTRNNRPELLERHYARDGGWPDRSDLED